MLIKFRMSIMPLCHARTVGRAATGLIGLGGLVLLAALTSCGASGGHALSGQEMAAVEQGKANARLQGSWRLVDFHADSPLEPFFQAWLDSQKNTLIVRFHDGLVTAQSSTLTYEKPYTITEAYDTRFAFASPGNSGLTYTSKCQFMPDGKKLLFHTQTEPLRGEGLLERVGP